MKYKGILVCLLTFIFILSSCSKNEEVINFKNKNVSNNLLVQKVVNNSSSTKKNIEDKHKIHQLLTMLVGLKVKRVDKDKTQEKMTSQEGYMFGFYEGDEMNTGNSLPYEFIVLKDGTFIFLSDDFNSKPSMSITSDKHKDLLKRIKTLLGIDF